MAGSFVAGLAGFGNGLVALGIWLHVIGPAPAATLVGVMLGRWETQAELAALREIGVNLFQGYLFAKPGFEALPKVDL